jgi:hypothetical protein
VKFIRNLIGAGALLVCLLAFQNCSPQFTSTQIPQVSTPNLPLLRRSASLSAESEGYDVIVIFGQSNAMGTGRQPIVDPAQPSQLDPSYFKQTVKLDPAQAADSRLFQILRSDDEAPALDGTVSIPGIGPINTHTLAHWHDNFSGGPDKGMIVGMGKSLARSYAQSAFSGGRKVLIVPAARGGASIQEILGTQNCFDPHPGWSCPKPYDDMIKRIRYALAQPGSRLVGFVWVQGEADIAYSISSKEGLNPESGAQFYLNFMNLLLAKIKNDILLPYAIDSVPFLIGEWSRDFYPDLATIDMRRHFEISIKAWVAQVNAGGLPGTSSYFKVGFVPSVNLAANAFDQIHFSSDSQINYGSRMASAIQALATGQPLPTISENDDRFDIINGAYLLSAGRLPTNTEIDAWIPTANDPTNPAPAQQIADAVRSSLQSQPQAAYPAVINAVYKYAFGRQATPKETAAWINAAQSSVSENGVQKNGWIFQDLRDYLNDQKKTLSTTELDTMITQAYILTTGRDQPGAHPSWEAKLRSQAYQDVVNQIASTCNQYTGNYAFAVGNAYTDAFHRDPSSKETVTWVTKMQENPSVWGFYDAVFRDIKNQPH